MIIKLKIGSSPIKASGGRSSDRNNNLNPGPSLKNKIQIEQGSAKQRVFSVNHLNNVRAWVALQKN